MRPARELKLSNSDKVVLVDEDDFLRFEPFTWRLSHNGYAIVSTPSRRRRQGAPNVLRLHRLILGARSDQIVDHINGDRLDNRKANLRFCTVQENNRNAFFKRGRMKGVYRFRRHIPAGFEGSRRGWFAVISTNASRRQYLGSFYTEQEAHEAYRKAAELYHGEFSVFAREASGGAA